MQTNEHIRRKKEKTNLESQERNSGVEVRRVICAMSKETKETTQEGAGRAVVGKVIQRGGASRPLMPHRGGECVGNSEGDVARNWKKHHHETG